MDDDTDDEEIMDPPIIPHSQRVVLGDSASRIQRMPGIFRPRPAVTPPMVVVHVVPPPKNTVFTPPKLEASPVRQQHGYRWEPVTPPSSSERSDVSSPNRSGTSSNYTPTGYGSPDGLRRSPRKRLVYFQETTNPPTPKKAKFDFSPKPSPPLPASLNSLSNGQLIELIGTLAKDFPEIQNKLADMIPVPDIKPIEAHIKQLRYCIHKALPGSTRSRISSKTDTVAFSRTEVHMYNLKKYIYEMGNKLEKSEHWPVVVEFAIMAWNSVRMTPVWDKPIHNATKEQCYRFLSKLMAHAIREGNFAKEELVQIQKQTDLLERDSPCSHKLNANLKDYIERKEREDVF